MKTIELPLFPQNLPWCQQKCLLSQQPNAEILPIDSWSQDCELARVAQKILTPPHCHSKLAAGALHHWLQNPSKSPEDALQKQDILRKLLETTGEQRNSLREGILLGEQFLATQYAFDSDTNAPEWTEQIWFSMKFMKEWNDQVWIHQPWTLLQLYLQPMSQLVLPILFLLAPLIFMWATGIRISWEQIQPLWKKLIMNALGLSILSDTSMNMAQKARAVAARWVTVGFYVYGIYSQFQLSIRLQKLASWIHQQVHAVQQFWTAAQIYRESFEADCPTFTYDGPNWSQWVREQLPACEEEVMSHYWWPTRWMRPAQYWAAWSKWQKLEQHTREWLKWLSQALAYDQLAQWIREERLGFVQWNDEKRKYGWKKAYHPMFWESRDKTKLSTWKWGRKTQFLLISGPNASGKTTFLKMATYLHWIGQAWGVTTAKEAKLPWIHTFWSWIRVPDQTGQESLFEAEVKRARELLDEMKNRTSRGERVWIWMDEVLSSTNWEESAATCYATLKQLVGKDSLVWGGCTTHIGALEELERKTHRKIQCVHFKMENKENSLQPTYEIKKGMSHQNLALSWIRQNKMLKGNEDWDGDAEWMVKKMRSQGAVQ